MKIQMIKKSCLITLCIVILSVLGNVSNALATVVSGAVSGTWSKSGSPYIVSGDNIYIWEGDMLIIEPGVEVRFDDFYSIDVWGELIAIGTESEPILFTLNNPETIEKWRGIRIEETSPNTQIIHCRIEFGETNIMINGASPEIKYCNITRADRLGENIGIHGGSSPLIENNKILFSRNMGIQMWEDASPNIKSNLIMGNQCGISCPDLVIDNEVATPIITNNDIVNNWNGIYINGEANPNIGNLDNTFTNDDGNNMLINKNGNILNRTPNTIFAQGNWWGTTDPNDFLIEGALDYSYYLQSAPRHINYPEVFPEIIYPGPFSFMLLSLQELHFRGIENDESVIRYEIEVEGNSGFLWRFIVNVNDPNFYDANDNLYKVPYNCNNLAKEELQHESTYFWNVRALLDDGNYVENGWMEFKVIKGDIINDGGGRGAAWADVNDDGYLDLYVSNCGGSDLLYININGNFSLKTTGPLPTSAGSNRGFSWGNYDNNNGIDLYACNYEENTLYKNYGDDSFEPITDINITQTAIGDFGTCSWGDYNNDGCLDLYITGDWEANHFYINNCDGTFREEINSVIIEDDELSSNSCSWADYNNDGCLDLFVANAGTNYLFENNCDGTFTQIETGPIVEDQDISTAGSWGDYDNDGDLDLFVANGFPFGARNSLYRNEGNNTFSKVTLGPIVEDEAWFTNGSWGDYDNDGDLDIFVTTFLPFEKNILYLNNGDGTFDPITDLPFCKENFSWCGIWGDYNRDGALELFVANDRENYLYTNELNSNNWINIKCVGTISNTSAIGTKVRVKALINGQNVWQMREISAQTGWCAQNSLNAAFGLGDTNVIDEIRVEWPSGIVQILNDVAVNQFLTIVEQQSPEQAIQAINDYIQGLDDNMFDKNAKQRKNALSNKLEAVLQKIIKGSIQGAINQLQNDIRAKMDGSVGGNPKNDWIIDPTAQQELVDKIDALIQLLEGEGLSKPSTDMMHASVESEIPDEFRLLPNYPNPFNPITEIFFNLPKESNVRIRVFDTLGRLVRTLTDQNYVAGTHNIVWDGRDQYENIVPSGLYFARMEAGEFSSTIKMLMTK